MYRIKERTLSEISNIQYSVMPDRGTRKTSLCEEKEKEKDVDVCFIYYIEVVV